jgi:beta-glucosidase
MAGHKLVGFERLTLRPGEARDVTIHIGAREWSFYSVADRRWVVAGGTRTVFVGASSGDLRLRAEVRVAASR